MPKSKSAHKQTVKKMHRHRMTIFFGMAAALIAIQFTWLAQTTPGNVLAYAVSVSIGELANLTNQKRAENGLAPLSVNSQLNNGAQAKANHMVANNYWAHTAPDGTEPWYFFDTAGYNYIHAGENLAYGFADSAEMVDAWMNSPGHKANILGDYKEMGFGITNGSNYQSGQYTVVAAFYGTQAAPPAPTPEPTPAPVVAQAQATAPEAEPAPVPVESAAEPTTTPAPEVVNEDKTEEPKVTVAAPTRVTNLQNLLSGNASWAVYASLGVITAAVIGFAITHRKLIVAGWRHSTHFILVHPLIDLAVIAVIVGLVLAGSAGFIR
ncbi:MAG TPA: CAP domain-containing protein [Candidatus Saccharimonadales bacterium]|nr:CAP domain-containing protein [Candidatus Saccharimonadales bacterium]